MNTPDQKTAWKDRNGKTHVVQFTMRSAMQIRDQCEVDLLAPLQSADKVQPVMTQLAQSPQLVLELLSIVENIPEAELTQFFDLFDGDAFEAASEAVLWAIIEFFPQRPRMIFLAILKRTREAWATLGQTAETEILERVALPKFLSDVSDLLTHGNGLKS